MSKAQHSRTPAIGEWTTDDWPDWVDTGRTIEMESEQGGFVIGTLAVGDFFPDGEGGEVPCFELEIESGLPISLTLQIRWRYLD